MSEKCEFVTIDIDAEHELCRQVQAACVKSRLQFATPADTVECMQRAFRAFAMNACDMHDVHIAGGCAHHLCLKCRGNAKTQDELHSMSYLHVYGGDIDLFCETFGASRRLVEMANDLGLVVCPSVTGNAVNVDVAAMSKVTKPLAQIIVIPETFAPIEQVLSKFDIVNAMCAFNVDGFIVERRIVELLERGELQTRCIDTPFTIKRLVKYAQRYGREYTRFSRQTSRDIIDKSIEFYERALAKEPFEHKKTDFTYLQHNVTNDVSSVLRFLESSDLLRSSMVLSGRDEGYNALAQKRVIEILADRCREGSLT